MTVATPTGRTFVCRKCRQEKTVDTTRGPLPAVCCECDPERAAIRERTRASKARGWRWRGERIRTLEAENAELRGALTQHDPLAVRARQLPGEPSRGQVARMVAILARAEGKQRTIDALLNVAAAATAWARALGAQLPAED